MTEAANAPEGQLIEGRYRIVRRIAQGGMATVYEARDERLQRTVAIKVMRTQLAQGPHRDQFIERFRREARSAARIANPHIVQVYDTGEFNGLAYLVMEYVHGVNLRHEMNEQGAFDVRETLRVLAETLDGLAAAHQANVVHRDIKPENIMINDRGRVQITDFGLAKATSQATLSSTGMLLGTAAYLSPETIERNEATPQGDLYALGVMAWEMLVGEVPFLSDNPMTIVFRHVHEDVPALRTVCSGIDETVERFVAHLTARAIGDRPANASEALAELRELSMGLTPEAWLYRRPSDAAETSETSAASAQAATGEGAPAPAVPLPPLSPLEQIARTSAMTAAPPMPPRPVVPSVSADDAPARSDTLSDAADLTSKPHLSDAFGRVSVEDHDASATPVGVGEETLRMAPVDGVSVAAAASLPSTVPSETRPTQAMPANPATALDDATLRTPPTGASATRVLASPAPAAPTQAMTPIAMLDDFAVSDAAAASASPRSSDSARSDATRAMPSSATARDASDEISPDASAETDGGKRRRPGRGKRIAIAVVSMLLVVSLCAGGGAWWYFLGPGSYWTVPKPDDVTCVEGETCSVEGAEWSRYESTLKVTGLPYKIVQSYSDDIAKGQIVSMRVGKTPATVDSRVSKRHEERLTVVISRGVRTATIPDDILDPQSANGKDPLQALKDAGFTNVSHTGDDDEYSETLPEGAAASISPDPGSTLAHNEKITVTLSKGPMPVSMPDVVGRARADVEANLAALKLSVNWSEEYSDTVDEGQVVSASVAQGTQLHWGDSVDVVVSKGPEMVTVPDVRGKSYDEAAKTLQALGLEVKKTAPLGDLTNTVRLQDPDPGQQVRVRDQNGKKTTVTLTVV